MTILKKICIIPINGNLSFPYGDVLWSLVVGVGPRPRTRTRRPSSTIFIVICHTRYHNRDRRFKAFAVDASSSVV